MNGNTLRRVGAGLLVLLLGTIAALPYARPPQRRVAAVAASREFDDSPVALLDTLPLDNLPLDTLPLDNLPLDNLPLEPASSGEMAAAPPIAAPRTPQPLASMHAGDGPTLLVDPVQPPRPLVVDSRPAAPSPPPLRTRVDPPSQMPAPAAPALPADFPAMTGRTRPLVPVVAPPPPPTQTPGAALAATASVEHPALRRHRLRDGDTLAKLAERYLGDAGRAEEIFRLNGDVLHSPRLLPLGVEIRLPSRELAAPSSGLVPVRRP